ncbi:hypothetical protein RI129_007875 [Pyrocoelia pectoralis]|uniref:Cytochrome P450 n=1 Tax=Pyrocoelia pectoralis TaxID=417401 RepID=A0AAN7ZF94_9COLE
MWTILLIVVLVSFYFKLRQIYNFWRERRVPYVKPVYILGNFARRAFRLGSMHDCVDKIYNTLPDVRCIGFYTFLQPMLMIRDLELIKQITVKDFDSFSDHNTPVLPSVDKLWSKNLFSLTSDRGWNGVRATVSPAFTGSKMRKMFVLMQDCSEQFVTYLKIKEGMITMEMKESFSRYGTDVIGSTAFGITCNSLKEQNNEFYLMGKELTDLSGLKGLKLAVYSTSSTLAKLFSVKVVSDKVGKFFSHVIEQNLQERRNNQIVRHDMIHMLMKAQKGEIQQDNEQTLDTGFPTVQEHNTLNTTRKSKIIITDEDITAHATGFFFAGFETTSTLLSYLMYELAVNPDIQNKLYLEIQQIKKNSNERITYEELINMKYLDNVVAECLRLHSPVTVLDRKCTKSYTIEPKTRDENAILIETGQKIWIPVRQIQRDPRFYPNPLKFDPNRFNDDNKNNIIPFTYLPFGIGPRNCLGSRFALLECKVITVDILRHFQLVCTDKTEIPIKLDSSNLTPFPKNGIWLGLNPRN